ncbi:MAG: glutathione S-transferase C-terminal domain-containing protein [Colwellia sp.]|nr:glutathione S-transferase C-terminal domain-containing protein [Aureispira sp.]MBL4764538.1 glutathione S-transferase C-terminal domain-containing protein [Colwellia sp.]
MLVNGQWKDKWQPVQNKDEKGHFIRQSSAFRETISPESMAQISKGEHPYKLYVAYICPWATRTLIARSLLGLESYIPISVLEPLTGDFGWQFGDFPGSTPAANEQYKYIHQMYIKADDNYTGRATVPVLWDIERQTIINNESADIVRIFDQDLRPLHQSSVELYPAHLTQDIDNFNEHIYMSLNNGVYRTGFAVSQAAYDESVNAVFSCLDGLEIHFQQQKYAVGAQLTESDIRLFVTLSRFDVAYHGLFKANVKMLKEYKNLSAYMERLLKIAAFSKNTHIDHIKAGYYSIKALNPTTIVPKGPQLDWFKYLGSNV